MRPVALLVDRSADNRRMYAEYLRFVSWRSEEATDGRDGFIKALTRPHDAIVMETRLAFISGFELCRILKHDRLTAAVPIVFVTGDGFRSNVEHARRAGADSVLVKPCLPSSLAVELNRLRVHQPPDRVASAGRRRLAKLTRSLVRCPSCHGRLLDLSRADALGRFDYVFCSVACGTFGYRREATRERKAL
ncbi:MAG TPA: response regulator [Vicinamibacterales bacterium]|nr:response regulator [Vicinamibacterales bacterium]